MQKMFHGKYVIVAKVQPIDETPLVENVGAVH